MSRAGARSPAWRAVVAAWLLAAAACSHSAPVAIDGPEYLAAATGDALALTDRVKLAGLDRTIAYPDGWYAESAVPYTNIAGERADVRRWFDGSAVQGPLIFFEVESVDFMRSVGVGTSDPTPDDLLAFSTAYFDWENLRDRVRVSLFGGHGVQVRAQERRGHLLAIQGVLPDERVVLITVVAPTGAMLDATLPTWRAMAGTLQADGPSALSVGEESAEPFAAGPDAPALPRRGAPESMRWRLGPSR